MRRNLVLPVLFGLLGAAPLAAQQRVVVFTNVGVIPMDRERVLYDAARAARFIALRGRLIKALHDGGVGLLLGSDAPQVMNVPGFSVHKELRALVAAGLTPYQALVTAPATWPRTGAPATGPARWSAAKSPTAEPRLQPRLFRSSSVRALAGVR